jgi:MFS family permease
MNEMEHSQPKIFYGWIITGVVFLTLTMGYGAQYSFGIFFPSLIEEFQWDRQSISGAFSLYAFMYCVLAAILGRWTDRFGPRIVLIFGSILLGAGISLISQVKTPWHLYVVYGLLASWGMSAVYMTAFPTVVKWFIERRGLALGITHAGLGVGIILIPPLSSSLIVAFGWRQACIVLGGIVFVVLFILAFFLVGQPEKVGLLPDGRTTQTSDPLPALTLSIQEVTWSAGEAFRTRTFWVLTALFFLTWLFIFFPLVHLVIFAMDIGFSRKAALMALSILGGASAFGRLGMGYISDRIGRKQTLVMNLVLQIFSWIWVMNSDQSWMLLLFAVVFGFSYGGISVIFPGIVGDYFGRLKAGSVIGAMFAIAGTAAAFGPLVGGSIHDLTGDYRLAFLLAVFSNVLSFILVFLAKPPVKNDES